MRFSAVCVPAHGVLEETTDDAPDETKHRADRKEKNSGKGDRKGGEERST